MNIRKDEAIQKEIRRRAFQRYDCIQKQKRQLQSTRLTLDALHEVTGLSRPELQAIADKAGYSCTPCEEGFFSIRNQFGMVFGALGMLGLLVWMLVRWWV
jgi:hypothetical protein